MRKQRGETNPNPSGAMHPHNGSAPTPSSSVSSSGSASTNGSSLGSAGVGGNGAGCVLSPPSSTNGTATNGALGCILPNQTLLDQNQQLVNAANDALNGSCNASSPNASNGVGSRYNHNIATHNFIQPSQMYTNLSQNPMDHYR